jgi:hypothetical protein
VNSFVRLRRTEISQRGQEAAKTLPGKAFGHAILTGGRGIPK